jgi:hypothetical protein
VIAGWMLLLLELFARIANVRRLSLAVRVQIIVEG